MQFDIYDTSVVDDAWLGCFPGVARNYEIRRSFLKFLFQRIIVQFQGLIIFHIFKFLIILCWITQEKKFAKNRLVAFKRDVIKMPIKIANNLLNMTLNFLFHRSYLFLLLRCRIKFRVSCLTFFHIFDRFTLRWIINVGVV